MYTDRLAILMGVPDLLPRFTAALERIEDAKRIGEIIIEGGEVEAEAGKLLRSSADGHRNDRMRGCPVIAKGVRGTAPGTGPLSALLAKERRQGR
jgi:hypothetical protein